MEMLTTLTAQLSNALQVIFLLAMIFAALVRLTDGHREQFVERVSLFLISVGAFFQLVKAAHPSGTSFEVLITHAGMGMWMVSQLYEYYFKKEEI